MAKNKKNRWRKFPLIGGLIDCKSQDYYKAFGELILTLLFSTLPIFIALIVDHYKLNLFFLESFKNNLSNGELFLYSTSILAPIFYTVLDDSGAKRTFPEKMPALIVYGGLMLISALVYALQKAGVALNSASLFQDSTIIFIISTFLLYLVIVLNNNRISMNPQQEMQEQENDFVNEYKKHRGG